MPFRSTCFNPGEIASTGGTSGVVYGVNGNGELRPASRVNTFAHVNHAAGTYNRAAFPATEQTRLGVLLCINGTGILNSWIKRNIAPEGINYNELNDLAGTVPVGSEGLSIIPFGNGAERVMQNKETGCAVHGINFNIHGRNHIVARPPRKALSLFPLRHRRDEGMGMDVNKIHAGQANMFLSPSSATHRPVRWRNEDISLECGRRPYFPCQV